MSELKVGSKLYSLIEFRDRKYRNGECFKEHVISGETPRSWIISKHKDIKVSKKDLTSDNAPYGRDKWYTEEDTLKYQWVWNNSTKVDNVLRKYQISDTLGKYELCKMLYDLFSEKGLIE
jgi:hypothetical protein